MEYRSIKFMKMNGTVENEATSAKYVAPPHTTVMFSSEPFLKRKYLLQYMATLSMSLCSLHNGMQFGWSGPTLVILTAANSTIPITSDEGSWLVSLLQIGGIFGVFATALCIDMCGRKVMLLLGLMPTIIGAFLYTIATNIYLLYAGRFLCGITQGVGMVESGIYISEIASPNIRGRLFSFTWILSCTGTFTQYLIAPHLSIHTNGYVLMVAPVLCFLTFMWMPESPYYYTMVGNLPAARKSLVQLQGGDVEKNLTAIQDSIKGRKSLQTGIYEMFTTPTNRKAFFILFLMAFGMVMSGGTYIVMYAQMIFQQLNSPLPADTSALILAIIPLFASVTYRLTVDSLGRRPLLITACIVSTFALITIAVFLLISNQMPISLNLMLIPVIILYINKFVDSVGFIPMYHILVGELFDPSIKSTATCAMHIFLFIFSSITIKLIQFISDTYGLHVIFFMFFVIKLSTGILVIFKIPETKKLSLQAVQEVLKVSC